MDTDTLRETLPTVDPTGPTLKTAIAQHRAQILELEQFVAEAHDVVVRASAALEAFVAERERAIRDYAELCALVSDAQGE